MNKLTLGCLIDEMKVGDIARSTKKMTDKDGYIFIQRYQTGFWTFNGQDIPDINNYDRLELENCYTRYEYEILPKYVSLNDAMKSLKDGYTVRCYPEDDGGYIEFSEADTLQSVSNDWAGLTWGAFLHSKWTIER